MKGHSKMNYSKRGTQRKQKELRSISTKIYSKLKIWSLRIGIASIIGCTVISGYAGLGLLNGILDNAPSIDENHIEPENFASTIYDNEGNEVYKLVGSDANRITKCLYCN